MNISHVIAQELTVKSSQVEAAVVLLDEGATVPFIARYRKEATAGLDDTQLRHLQERLVYLRELQQRKETVLKSISEQGKLTAALEEKIAAVDSKSTLEDLYLPYKPKRRSKAQQAREAGLLPLAEQLLAQPEQQPEELAKEYLNTEAGIDSVEKALAGAQQILMEKFAEDAEITGICRQLLWQQARLKTEAVNQEHAEAQKFRDYFAYEERLATIPSHRALAIFRGRQLEQLKLSFMIDDTVHQKCCQLIADKFALSIEENSANAWLAKTLDWAWRIKLLTRLEVDCLLQLREQAEREAIEVFATNLQDLLMASPAGAKVTMGLDPGYRTGVKVVVIDATGKLLQHTTIFPHPPQKQWQQALATLVTLCRQHRVELLSIGNGTASRETDKLAAELIKAVADLKITKIVISEAGASVYSASELAAKEFPHLDVSFRGAVSIARRLQDPLAELVKIDPKAIGVGQYQHDVNQSQLAVSLHNVVEDCVNQVGVDLNLASAPLLARISGLNQSLATNIVSYREEHGAFKNREALKSVPRMGEKTYQQCAGFLRIRKGDNPLDASAVHPEAYPVVKKILNKTQLQIETLISNSKVLKKLQASDYTDERFGTPTVLDIIDELHKPGRDPRPEFKMAIFKEGVETLDDLLVGMSLEGTVTNVTHFGAFIDIGVHQDGLVHKSQVADHFVEQPSDLLKVGQIVQVTVLELDKERRRIALTMKSSAAKTSGQQKRKKQAAQLQGAMAAAFSEALASLRS